MRMGPKENSMNLMFNSLSKSDMTQVSVVSMHMDYVSTLERELLRFQLQRDVKSVFGSAYFDRKSDFF